MALFNLFGKNKTPTEKKDVSAAEHPVATLQDTAEQQQASSSTMPALDPKPAPVATKSQPKQGFFGRIKSGLSRTRGNLGDGLSNLFLGAKQIDNDLFEELETQLLVADVGIEATASLLKKLSDRVARKDLQDPPALYKALKEELAT